MGKGLGRVRLFVGNRGSGRANVSPGQVGSGRVQEKWPVDNFEWTSFNQVKLLDLFRKENEWK